MGSGIYGTMDILKRMTTNDIYVTNSKPRGYVLLINIEKYENEAKQRRLGSLRDFLMLKDMWEDFGYKVIDYYDLYFREFQDAVVNFAKMPELEYVDSAITFIMSHGKEDTRNPHAVLITTADDKYVSSDWIKDKFSAVNCPALINKPKILFFQACRGSLQDYGVNFLHTESMNSGHTMIRNKLVPILSDLLIVYPTLPGYVSQRDTLLGAYFVQECIAVFNEDSPHLDLLSMLSKVDDRIRRMCSETGVLFQVVYYESWGFNKKMYFFPKNSEKRYTKNLKPKLVP